MEQPTSKDEHPEHCLNCGKHLRGRYCTNCGQDSLEHPDSIWHLVQHFFNDITHYDGKLWKTIKPLIVKPGFLTLEYLRGKRASYLNPVRLFIFLNFIFFLLIAWLPSTSKEGKPSQVKINVGNNGGITLAKYDSLQNALPYAKRDGELKTAFTKKLLAGGDRLAADPKLIKECIEMFFHNAGSLTFLFLLFCTGLLGLLYFRMHLLMINHALFAIHVSCTFLLLSVCMLLISYLPYGVLLAFIIFLYGNYYFYKALRSVYHQSFIKTAIKFIVMEITLLMVMSTAVFANLAYALMNIKS